MGVCAEEAGGSSSVNELAVGVLTSWLESPSDEVRARSSLQPPPLFALIGILRLPFIGRRSARRAVSSLY